MAFQKLNVEKKFYQYKNLTPNQSFEGTYIKVGEDRFGGITHEFRDSEKELIHVLNSSGHLNYLMKEHASFGDYCRVTYKGKQTLPKTSKFAGKESHTFDLEIDPERSVKIAPTTSTEDPNSQAADNDLEDETL